MKVLICVLALAVTTLAKPQVFGGNNGLGGGIGGGGGGSNGDGYRYNQPEQTEVDEQRENNIQDQGEDEGQTVRIIKEEVQPAQIKTLRIIHESEPEVKTIQIVRQHPPPPPIIKHVQLLREAPPPPPEVKTVSVVHQPPPPPAEVKQVRIVHPHPPPPTLIKTVKFVHPHLQSPPAVAASAPVPIQIPVMRHFAASLPVPPPLPVSSSIVSNSIPVSASAPIPVSAPAPVPVGPAYLGSSAYGFEHAGLSGYSGVIGGPSRLIHSPASFAMYPATYAAGAPSIQFYGSGPIGAGHISSVGHVSAAPTELIGPSHFVSNDIGYASSASHYGLPVYGAPAPIYEGPIAGEELKYLRLVKK